MRARLDSLGNRSRGRYQTVSTRPELRMSLSCVNSCTSSVRKSRNIKAVATMMPSCISKVSGMRSTRSTVRGRVVEDRATSSSQSGIVFYVSRQCVRVDDIDHSGGKSRGRILAASISSSEKCTFPYQETGHFHEWDWLARMFLLVLRYSGPRSGYFARNLLLLLGRQLLGFRSHR